MHTISGQEAFQPVKQKVRVYNPNLLSELLLEAEKAKQQQVQVWVHRTIRMYVTFGAVLTFSVLHSVTTCLLNNILAAACSSKALVTLRRLKAKMPILAVPNELARRETSFLKAMVYRNALIA